MADTFVKVGLIIVIIFLVGILAVLSGFVTTPIGFLTIPGFCITGSGNLTSETRTVETFHSVELRGFGNLHITQDETHELRVEGEDNILSLLKTYVSNGVLIIEQEGLKCIRPTKPLNIYVTMKEVNKLSISGSGDIIGQTKITSNALGLSISGSGDIDLEVDTTKLNTNILGSGDVQLKGVTRDHDITITGSGNVKSYDLITEKSTVKVLGSGKSEVSVSSDLEVTITGSGDVYYKGEPVVNTQISGSGKLKKV